MADLLLSEANRVWRSGGYGWGELSVRRIAMGIDSLTDGSGGTSYRSTFMARLRAAYGDAGVGIGGIDDDRDGQFSRDTIAGATDVTTLAWSDACRVKSFFGRGRVFNNVTAGTLNKRDTAGAASRYGSVTVWVEFTASGQTIKIKPYFGAVSKEVTYTSDNFALNVPVPIHFPLSVENTNFVGIGTTVNTNGANDLFIWADDWHLATPASGVQFTNLGIGGTSLANWMTLDATRFATWMGILRPHGWVMNGGMNDRGSALNNANAYVDKIPATAAVYRNLDGFVGRIKAGWPSVRGLLVVPNDTDDRATTIIGYYPEMCRAIAADYGWALSDDQTLLGLSAAAIAAGYMTAGNVHPTSTGNARRGNAYADIFAPA